MGAGSASAFAAAGYRHRIVGEPSGGLVAEAVLERAGVAFGDDVRDP